MVLTRSLKFGLDRMYGELFLALLIRALIYLPPLRTSQSRLKNSHPKTLLDQNLNFALKKKLALKMKITIKWNLDFPRWKGNFSASNKSCWKKPCFYTLLLYNKILCVLYTAWKSPVNLFFCEIILFLTLLLTVLQRIKRTSKFFYVSI